MADSLTLTLPGKTTTITWNGHIETMEERGAPNSPRTYLWELDADERAARMALLRERLA